MTAETPTRPIAIVASRNGAPMIAPTATSSAPSAPPTIATIGMSVSGIAVPTAARIEPTAPSPRFNRWPIHSMAFVKRRAPARITANEMRRRMRGGTPASTYLDHHRRFLVCSLRPTSVYARKWVNRPPLPLPRQLVRSGVEESQGEEDVDGEKLNPLPPVRFALLRDVVGDQHCDQNTAELEAVEDERHRVRPDDE